MTEDLYTLFNKRIDEAFEKYDTLYSILLYSIYQPLEGILKEAENHISCRKGCAHCCKRLVATTRLEGAALMEYIKSKPEEYTDYSFEKIRNHSSNMREFFDTLSDNNPKPEIWFSKDLYCPFLKNSVCSVYALRPLSCRIFHSMDDPEKCKVPIRKVKQYQLLLDAEAMFQVLVHKIAMRVDGALAVSGMLSLIAGEILESDMFKKDNP